MTDSRVVPPGPLAVTYAEAFQRVYPQVTGVLA
jgi:hypothetical protein